MWTYQLISEAYNKNLEATLLLVEFSKEFDSIQREKMEQILLVYGLSKETIFTIMMLHQNIKVMIPNGSLTDVFDIVNGVWQVDMLTPMSLCIFNLPGLHTTGLHTMSIILIKNVFTLKKTKNRWHPSETMTYADYADDLMLSHKYTCPIWILADNPGTSNQRHCLLYEYK